MNHDPENTNEDFGPLEHQLRAGRPTPTDAELDRVRHRAMAADRSEERSRRGIFSPARLAMVSLVSGLLLVGGSGASLAVSGLSSDGSAGKAQYIQTPSTTSTPTDTGGVAPSQDQGGADDPGCSTSSAQAAQTNCPEDETGTAPSIDQGDTEPAADQGTDPAQETRQIANGGTDNRLPFTGFLALPLLLVGVMMLATGFVLRRTSAQKLG